DAGVSYCRSGMRRSMSSTTPSACERSAHWTTSSLLAG
ncbi:hypothetical protein BMAJHU_I1221, partial [Burkholderia mallei JHU]